MSLVCKDNQGDEFSSSMNPFTQEIRIDEREMTMEEFCEIAYHWLSGGWFGWGAPTPPPVSKMLERLFTIYEKRADGTWQLITR
jgi:hypothetical protein